MEIPQGNLEFGSFVWTNSQSLDDVNWVLAQETKKYNGDIPYPRLKSIILAFGKFIKYW